MAGDNGSPQLTAEEEEAFLEALDVRVVKWFEEPE
jgi:hypothetical protein